MKKKVFIGIFFILLLFFMSSNIYAFEDADNGFMKYYLTYGNVDIKGYVGGELQSTTFCDRGYRTKLKVNNREIELNMYDYGEQKVEGIEWDIKCSFINKGKYVKLIYILKNTNDEPKTISLGSFVDVQIAGNDKATLERFENSNGIKLYDTETNIQFSFYGKAVAGTTDIDNLWIGKYPEYANHCFDSNTTQKLEEIDSAFCYSWNNRTINAGETKIYSVIIGMGEVSNAPKIELDENQGNCFSKENVIINGTVSDADPNSKVSVQYEIDSGDEEGLPEQSLINNKADFSLDLTSKNLTVGMHDLKLWAVDEEGNPSEIITKRILITNLKAPTLNMNEEWSKEDVTFTLTDTNNNADEVKKYQYKIEGSEWRDVTLEESVVALSNTGTKKVWVKVIGNNEGEEVTSAYKIAKVDKNAPTINVKEENYKIKIESTDTESGLKETKYIISEKRELDSNDEYMLYSGEFGYNGNSTGDLYLHVISSDKLGNQNSFMKQYKAPITPEIELNTEYVNQKPTYKIVGNSEQINNGYTYSVKINNGEWINVNHNQEYRIETPQIGTNKVQAVTVDPLGRKSDIKEKETTYSEGADDNTKAPVKLPNAGVSIILIAGIVISLVGTVILYNKVKEYRDVK